MWDMVEKIKTDVDRRKGSNAEKIDFQIFNAFYGFKSLFHNKKKLFFIHKIQVVI